jgi:hypothetical protein
MWAQTIDLPAWLVAVTATLGLVGTVAASFAVSRQVAIKASLESIITANAELRADNEHLRTRLDDAAKTTANLEGKLEVFTSHFAEQIVKAVIDTVERTSVLQSRVTAESGSQK